MAKEKVEKVEPRIIEAVGTATGAQYGAKTIEDAMVAAVYKCLEQGISDPDKILAAKLKARADLKKGAAS